MHGSSPAVVLLLLLAGARTGPASPDLTGTHAELSSGDLLVSRRPDRSGATPLEGASLRKEVFIFAASHPGAQQVEFLVDGVSRTLERHAPYDLQGGQADAAAPFDTATLQDGRHELTARYNFPAGVQAVTVAFTV